MGDSSSTTSTRLGAALPATASLIASCSCFFAAGRSGSDVLLVRSPARSGRARSLALRDARSLRPLQLDRHRRPAAGCVVDLELAAHGVGEPEGDRQPESDAGDVTPVAPGGSLHGAVPEPLGRLGEAVAL